MRIICILFFATLLAAIPTQYINSIPASPHPITVVQPDGSELVIRLRGDEFFNYRTTEDGYLLTKNKEGIFQYAELDSNRKIISTGVRARNVSTRTATEKNLLQRLTPYPDFSRENQASRMARVSQDETVQQRVFPSTGSPKSIVILVNFSDVSFVTPNPQVAFTNMLNQQGYSANGATGSARDYFIDSSNGVFNPDFVVVGPFTLPQNRVFYGGNDDSGNDKNPRQMVIDACKIAADNGVDFSIYDTDKDGRVDNVYIFYAGHNEAEGATADAVWPHRWVLNTNVTHNGARIYDYACSSELRGSTGSTMAGIGTFAHEFGHVLGLVDYYPTNGEKHHTLSYWNIMDAGAYSNQGRTPPSYSAYDRFYLNWLVPTELKSPQDVSLASLTSSNKAYIITQNGNHNMNGKSPSPVEFFTLENRQRTGWDTYLPASGLLVTRIYYNETAWRNNEPNNIATAMGVDIIEADGIASGNTLSGDPFPGSTNVTVYDPTLRNGTVIGKKLTQIKNESGVVTFKFMGGGDAPIILVEKDLTLFSTVQGTPSTVQSFKVSGRKLTNNINISLQNGSHYEIKKATDLEWGNNIALSPIDSIVDTTIILIRYNPQAPSFSDIHYDLVILSSTNADNESFALSGKSTRPVYVTTPVAYDASEMTEGSFIANWQSVDDASGYYISVYSLSDGVSSLTEGFDNGFQAPFDWQIISTEMISSSFYSGNSVPAIALKASGDGIVTEEYLIPVTSLSFFIRSMAASNSTLLVEAWDGNQWKVLDNVLITPTVNGTQKYTYSESDNYRRFRLTYNKVAGNLALDDVSAGFSKKLDFVKRNAWANSNKDTVNRLVSNTPYYYVVKASDKTLNVDKTIKYENITGYSNVIETATLKDEDASKLRHSVSKAEGYVEVYLSDLNEPLYIYNSIGQLVKLIESSSYIVRLTDLTPNQIYILKAGKRRAKIVF